MKLFIFKPSFLFPVLVFVNAFAQNTPPQPTLPQQNVAQPAPQNAPPPNPANVAPPEMPIPPEFMNTQNAPPQQPTNQPPPPPQQQPPPVPPPQAEPAQAPMAKNYDMIGINPYFKNKPRLGKLHAMLTNANTNEGLGSLAGAFGDCKNCLRGASLKGKIGVRIYGDTLQTLRVSRKSSSSIKLINCPSESKQLVNNSFTCEFVSENIPLKLYLNVSPQMD